MLRPWKITLTDRLRGSGETPLYMQIVHALIHEIQRGRLSPGAFLPSSRELATMLDVNRKTIVTAYDELVAQGWLSSDGTRGTIVSKSLPDAPVPAAHRLPPVGMTAAEYNFRRPDGRPLALAPGSWLKLDEGAPDGRLFPADVLARAYRVAVHRASAENRLQYRDPRGSPRLRESVAAMLRSERGLMVTPDNICITRGSQMAIYLAARILTRPGDAVLVERLTYEPAVAAFSDCGATIVPVRLDEHGVDVEDVERACRRHRVRAIFLTPHHQFPTTVSLRPDRRLRLLDLARQFAFAVIEDDYDHEYHFTAQPLLPMASYAPGHVIYAGSLSKLMIPALRIGYIAAPPEVIDAVSYAASLTDGMGNTVTEDAAAELIDTGEVRRHVRKTAQIYAGRRDAFAAALAEELGGLVDFIVPQGGLAFWLRFRDLAALARIEAGAAGAGLSIDASQSFRTHADSDHGLRIGFASLSKEEARAALGAIRKLARR